MKSTRILALGLRRATGLMVGLLLATGLGSTAHAVPSYARQTGSDCAACHVGGFGPQLTPYGIKFKLGGYTDSDGQGTKVPLSAMLVANWTRTAKDNPAPDPALHGEDNHNGGVQEASLFLAGRLTDNIGAFIQSTYAGFERKSSLDQLDIRYARELKLGGQEGIVGVSLNSNPTLTDPFNTLGQWRFPYTSSDFGFGTGASPLVENLAGGVLGLNAYTLWDNHFYGELGIYNSLSPSGVNRINTDSPTTPGIDPGRFKGPGVYWRFAYFNDRKRDNFSLGVFGFNAGIRNVGDPGTADRFRDLGVDASYQFLGNREHIVTLNASYVKEWQRYNYTFNTALASEHLRDTLDNARVALSYHYNQTWGVTGSLFAVRGTADSGLYGESAYNAKPNTSGYMLQADWTPWGKESSWGAPWANVRLGVQYTGYSRFNGGSHYIDDNGNDRRASDNNTWMLFLWTAI